MSDTVFAQSGAEVISPGRPRAFGTIVYGGLVAGVLDISYAMIFFGLRNGAAPSRILQSVASGLLGRDVARAGGLKTALLGLFLHFLIAFIVATIFYGASLILPTLIRHALIWGPLYGVAVYFVMNTIVLPLSAIGPRTSSTPWLVFLTGVSAIAFLVGLPVALFAKRSARNG
jgi:uncharacterized membrane protein YagU involved in acid resistance